MKKLLLSALVCLTLLLPAVATTTSASGHFANRVVDVALNGYALIATSGEEDGEIYKVQVYRASTGQLVRCVQGEGYEAYVDMSGLPGGGYNVMVVCANTTHIEQTKM